MVEVVLISVVIPMFNEQESVRPLLERLEATLRPLEIPFEVVVVDDGSADSTRERLLGFQPLARELSVVCLSRNFGLEGALEAGLRHARGDVVVLMDADLQDPPELIPTLLEAWRNGAEVVFTTKRTRAEPLARRAPFGGFHLLYHRLARIPSPLGAVNFSLIDRAALDAVLAMPERSRYLPGLRYWVGFRQVEVAYDRPERAVGRPSMTLSKLLKLALDGIFGFSHLPLRLATLLGACLRPRRHPRLLGSGGAIHHPHRDPRLALADDRHLLSRRRTAGLARNPRRVPEPRLRRGPETAQLHRPGRAQAIGRRRRRARAGESEHPERRPVACWSARGGTRRS